METNLAPSTDQYFNPVRLQQQLAIATHFFNAKCFGGNVQNPEQVFVLIQAGSEMNMGPMESMNSLYIVNGKITIYGMAMTKKLRSAGWLINYDESKENELTATITKGDEKYSYTATAKELLSLNSRAYKLAPKDKLKWHAISRLVRFYVPEVVGGTISYIKEEIEDMDFPMPEVKKEMAGEVLIGKLKTALKGATDEEKLIEYNQLSGGTVYTGWDIPKDEASEMLIKIIQSKK